MRPWMLALLAALAACTHGDDSGAPLSPCAQAALQSPSATLGTGSSIWEDLADGADLALIQGPQGGFHVYGSLRADGVHPGDWDDPGAADNPIVSFQVLTESGETGGYEDLPRPLKTRSDGQLELVGEIVVLDITSMGQAAGQQAQLSVSLTDDCGTSISDTRTVTLITGF